MSNRQTKRTRENIVKLEDKVHIIGVGFDGWKNCGECAAGFWTGDDGQTTCKNCLAREDTATIEPTQEQYLDNALNELVETLVIMGIDPHLGYRTPQVLRLSVSGATNLVALVNTLQGEIERLENIIGEGGH